MCHSSVGAIASTVGGGHGAQRDARAPRCQSGVRPSAPETGIGCHRRPLASTPWAYATTGLAVVGVAVAGTGFVLQGGGAAPVSLNVTGAF